MIPSRRNGLGGLVKAQGGRTAAHPISRISDFLLTRGGHRIHIRFFWANLAHYVCTLVCQVPRFNFLAKRNEGIENSPAKLIVCHFLESDLLLTEQYFLLTRSGRRNFRQIKNDPMIRLLYQIFRIFDNSSASRSYRTVKWVY